MRTVEVRGDWLVCKDGRREDDVVFETQCQACADAWLTGKRDQCNECDAADEAAWEEQRRDSRRFLGIE